jgi:hypothetical protein
MVIHDYPPLKKYLYYTIFTENSGEPNFFAFSGKPVIEKKLLEIAQWIIQELN